MQYSEQRKKEIIEGKPEDMSVIEYCKMINVSTSAYYSWIKKKEIISKSNPTFIEVSPIIEESIIDVEVNGIVIHVHESFDSKHLSNIIKTIKLL